MNARISKDFSFLAGIHTENSFVINSYQIGLNIEVNTIEIREQNIAMERIKLFLATLEDCVFVNEQEKAAIENYKKAGLKVCTLPDDPYDQVVAVVLMKKLNTITEEKLTIYDISILSLVCDDVKFYVSIHDQTEYDEIKNSWWTQNNIAIIDDVKKSHKKDKIVPLHKNTLDWNNVGLNFKEGADQPNSVLIELTSKDLPK